MNLLSSRSGKAASFDTHVIVHFKVINSCGIAIQNELSDQNMVVISFAVFRTKYSSYGPVHALLYRPAHITASL